MDLVLATINARYSHASFGLRWLWANLGELRERAAIREFDLRPPPAVIAEQLLAERPKVIGFGVYIWNVTPITQVAQIIKAVAPEVVLILGGPEASHEFEDTPIFHAADYLVRGEGELAFAELARRLLDGERPMEKVLSPTPPDLAGLVLPYMAYTAEDLARRTVYVETSRGCPFRCEFCLSSIGGPVRCFPLAPFFDAMEELIAQGARRFKFVDRTFNVSSERMDAVLDFFQARWQEGMQLHFEIVPDRLDRHALERIQAMPPGGLHLEVGVQSYHGPSQTAISRRQDLGKTETALRFLREETGTLLHADLIAGLPEEDWDSFANGFNRLWAARPHAIQVGILKRLKGAPIARHDTACAMAYAATPPYDVLQTHRLSFAQLQRIKRFARYFDLFVNSGDFPESLDWLWKAGTTPFDAFMAFSDWLWAETGRTHEFSLADRAMLLYRFLAERHVAEPDIMEVAIRRDFHRVPGRTDRLRFPR